MISTFLSLASALLVLGDVLGNAAWNGVNLAVGIYLVLAIGGALGLFAGFPAALKTTRVLQWITTASALAIAGLAMIFACGFILGRDRSVPLNSPIFVAGVHVPLIEMYGAATVLCLTEAFLYWPRLPSSDKNLETTILG